MKGFTLVATCMFGLEGFLGKEIDSLGLRRISTIDGRVEFEGSLADVCRANIGLRFAERVYIKLGQFGSVTFTALFDGTKSLPFEEFISEKDAFPVKGHCIQSVLFSVPDCQRIIKKAIVERLKTKYSVNRFEESGTTFQIDFFIFKNTVSIMIDTSGTPLHKRGYRPDSVAAPLRETLAAAVAAVSRPRENVVTWDPFCGSGTIAIEAAMMMAGLAPGLGRRFAYGDFPFITEEMQARAEEEAKSRKTDTGFRVFASDIDPDAVELTRANAERAGVADMISCFEMDARNISNPDGLRGTIVTNPPYGERLMTPETAALLYREAGEAFRRLENWQFYILTTDGQFEKHFGRKADKARRFHNGTMPCRLYEFYKKTKNG